MEWVGVQAVRKFEQRSLDRVLTGGTQGFETYVDTRQPLCPGCAHRFLQEFLFYHQKESDVGDDHINPVTPWDMMMRLVLMDFLANGIWRSAFNLPIGISP